MRFIINVPEFVVRIWLDPHNQNLSTTMPCLLVDCLSSSSISNGNFFLFTGATRTGSAFTSSTWEPLNFANLFSLISIIDTWDQKKNSWDRFHLKLHLHYSSERNRMIGTGKSAEAIRWFYLNFCKICQQWPYLLASVASPCRQC